MLVESVHALIAERRVVVTVPEDGPLCGLLREAGAEVVVLPVPMLRKSYMSPLGLVRLTAAALRALVPAVRLIRRERATALYVNTVTVPLWLVAGRLARVPVLCHVHEAEDRLPGPLNTVFHLPLRLARVVVANSKASVASIGRAVAARRLQVVYNGVGAPDVPVPGPRDDPAPPWRVVLVGRLSPRKGSDLAIKAVQILRQRGYKVSLTLVGDIFPGYEWYEAELRALAAEPASDGAVDFAGFRPSVWDSLADADVAVVPSRLEPFGLVAVEAMLAGRPVVACATQGLTEIVDDGDNGVLVAPDDPEALAGGLARVFDDWGAALAMAERGHTDALRRFSKEGYHHNLREVTRTLSPITPPAPSPRGLKKHDDS